MIPTTSPTIKNKKMKTPKDLSTYLETHYEIVSYLTLSENKAGTLAQYTRENEGIGGLYSLAQKLADEFEEIHTGTDWDGDFFDTLADFLTEKEYQHRANIQHENETFRIISTGTTYAVQYVEDGYIAQYFTTLAEAKKYIGAK